MTIKLTGARAMKVLLFSFFAVLIIAVGAWISGSGGPAPDGVSPPPTLETMPQRSPGYNVDFETFERGTVCYEGFLPNLVKQDFPDFGRAVAPSGAHVLSFSVWEALTNPEYIEQLGLTRSGEITVPAALVEQIALRYFDIASVPAHVTLEVHGLFSYSSDANCYTVPVMGMEEHLLPRVMDVYTESGRVLLAVDYLSALELEVYLQDAGPAPKTLKSVLIELTGDYREYKVVSLKLI